MHTYICMCTPLRLCMCVRICIYARDTYAYRCVPKIDKLNSCAHTGTHAPTHTHTYTNIYIYMQTYACE